MLTLAFDESGSIDSVRKTISVFQGRFRNKSKLVLDVAREVLNSLSQMESFPITGGILFAGQISTSKRKKEFFSIIIIPIVEGYEDYFRGYLDTRFYVEPLQKFLKKKQEARLKLNEGILTDMLSTIKKELAKKEPKILIGSSLVKKAIIENKAERVIISKKLNKFIFCSCCNFLLPLNMKKCEICESEIDAPKKSCFHEIKDLCKNSNIECIDFEDNITQILDDQYFSIVCFLRY